ncbi:undecaprenyl-diphosphatase UppP [Candidatus Parcubacteria bacterium]|nr:undecaprenyl-diphosphatase UppP [Candidatus Parcubacteria bacterium]
MTLIDSVILGVVEGITEFLPISSTAHLELTGHLLGIPATDFFKSFEVIIQLGAIMAVVVLYAQTISTNTKIWKRIITAFIPTGVVGFLLYNVIKDRLLNNLQLIIWTLSIGGVILIIFEYIYSKSERTDESLKELETMPYLTAFGIGLAQALAVVPGVSRAAATIVAGRVLGLGRQAIVEFSFLLAIPTMLAATSYDILKNASSFSNDNIMVLIVGFCIAFVSALITVRFLILFIQTHTFTTFGVYRILLAVVLALYIL